MEDVITYIVVFGLGFILVGIYLFGKEKKRVLPLSKQMYSDAIFTISVVKEQRKVSGINMALKFPKKAQTVQHLIIELVNTKKETSVVNITDSITRSDIKGAEGPFDYEAYISFVTFKKLLEEHSFPFESFRIIAETLEGKKYKSHYLGLHNWWNILKLDSGTYN
ncbi:MAG: hypothetical protein JXR71_09305 [Bacteroidales bacterium]|nr:hypothetical protein [Bacteroidales bacterium]